MLRLARVDRVLRRTVVRLACSTLSLGGLALMAVGSVGMDATPPANGGAPPPSTEALTGFDKVTNGFEAQEAFDEDREEFEEVETTLPDPTLPESDDSSTLQVTTDAAPAPPPLTRTSCPPPPTRRSWYVAMGGHDTDNDGSRDRPFKTIAKALTMATGGHSVVVRFGSYSGFAAKSGTCANAMITIRPYPGETITLTSKISFGNERDTDPRQYIALIGENKPSTYNPTDGSGGKTFIIDGGGIRGSCNNCRYENIEVKNVINPGAVSFGNGTVARGLNVHHNGDSDLQHGTYTHASDIVIEDSEYHHNSGWGLQLYNNKVNSNPMRCTQGQRATATTPNGCGGINNTVRNVKVYANKKGGLTIGKAGSGALLYNVIGYPGSGNTGKGGLHGAAGPGGGKITVGQASAKIFNVTLYANAAGGAACKNAQLYLGSSCDNCVARNILAWGSNRQPICVDPGATNTTVSHNKTGTLSSPIHPQVVSASGADFRVTAGSLAIDAGFPLAGIVTRDHAGTARPLDGDGAAGAQWDVGAFEYNGNTSCPSGDCTPSSVPTVALLLNNNTNNTGTAGGTPVATSIGFTNTPARLAEGTHAAVWNAATDVLTVPTTGFSSPTNTTIRFAFYADTAFGVDNRYLYGATSASPSYADRVQVYTDADRLGIGLGGAHKTHADVLGSALSINTLYWFAMRIYGDGTYDARLARDDVGVIQQVAGTFTSLSNMAATVAVGNNGATNTEGWRGSIDAFLIDNRILTDAELDAECATYMTTCPPVGAPT
jgi:hypothetical protein